MHYWIWLTDRKTGNPYIYRDSFLPGVIPQHVLEMMVCPGPLCRPSLDDAGLCEHCTMACHPHVMQPVPEKDGYYRHLCTVLFHDAVKPAWRMEDVV
jgi:hypothetical protein